MTNTIFPNTTDRKEVPWLHYLRVYACFLVVVLHATHISFLENEGEAFHSWLLCLARPCNCLFFMISGALLLPYNNDDFIAFYKKRLQRIVVPLLIWGCVYSILPFFLLNESIKSVIYNIVWLPLTYPEQYGGILWYLYIYIGIVLFIPFLSPKVYSDKCMLNAFLSIWFFCQLFTLSKIPVHIF